jgi:hypothetical protein
MRGDKVVDLRTRSGYQPDVAGLAREQIRTARAALDIDAFEFAKLLGPLLGWQPSAEAVESWETTTVPPGDVLVAAGLAAHLATHGVSNLSSDLVGRLIAERFGDLSGVFMTRSAFSAAMPPERLFEGASVIRAVGLSLNYICQQLADQRARELIEAGATMQCLFLDPASDAMRAREVEEGHVPGHLATLTELNIGTLTRLVGDRLSAAARDRLQVAVYTQTVRFNITIVDDTTCVVQPYLPASRGVEGPTFLIHRRPAAGLFGAFEQVFTALWDGGRRI